MLSTYSCEHCGPFFEEGQPDMTKRKHRCGSAAKLLSFRKDWKLCKSCKTPELESSSCRMESR